MNIKIVAVFILALQLLNVESSNAGELVCKNLGSLYTINGVKFCHCPSLFTGIRCEKLWCPAYERDFCHMAVSKSQCKIPFYTAHCPILCGICKPLKPCVPPYCHVTAKQCIRNAYLLSIKDCKSLGDNGKDESSCKNDFKCGRCHDVSAKCPVSCGFCPDVSDAKFVTASKDFSTSGTLKLGTDASLDWDFFHKPATKMISVTLTLTMKGPKHPNVLLGFGFARSKDIKYAEVFNVWYLKGVVFFYGDWYYLSKREVFVDPTPDFTNIKNTPSGSEEKFDTIKFKRASTTEDLARDVQFTVDNCFYFVGLLTLNQVLVGSAVEPEKICFV